MKATNDIRFDYAQVGGVKLHYARAGTGPKLVLLLHGFPEFWYSWRHQIAALSDEYTVVAPDMRGFNLSDKPAAVSDYKLEKVADDIIGLIDHFGWKDAAVIGHDWGASVAWTIASSHPEYLWKVGALQAPPAAIWRKNLTLRQFAASWYMFFFQLPVLPEMVLQFNDYSLLKNSLRSTAAKPDVFTDTDISEYKKAWSEPSAMTTMLNYYRANILGRYLTKPHQQKKITVPTLFIYGQHDHAILPETVKGIGEMVDAPFVDFRIPDSGHWVQQEAKDEVTDVIREFLSD